MAIRSCISSSDDQLHSNGYRLVGRKTFLVPTVADLVSDAARSLREPFRASDVLTWFKTNAPGIKESSIRAHIQALTGNATNRLENHPVVGARPAVLYRIDHGLYRRWAPGDAEPSQVSTAADVLQYRRSAPILPG